MKISLIGPPGSGKGTIGRLIKQDYEIAYVSVGKLLRDIALQDTKLGIMVNDYIDNGRLLPNEVVIPIVQNFLAQTHEEGYLLDGFPRMLEQALEFDKMEDLDLVILLNVEIDVIHDRTINRRMCNSCGAIYNIRDYKKDFCEKCDAKLEVRDDDNEESLRVRMQQYETHTIPVIEHYKSLGKLVMVDANGTIDSNYQAVKDLIESRCE